MEAFIFIAIVLVLAIVAYQWVIRWARFGHISSRTDARIKGSPNYRNGAFQNLEPTPALSEDTNMLKVMFRFLFMHAKDKKPSIPFTFQQVNLHEIPIEEQVYVWLGHSAYYLQVQGIRILVDPVLSGYASPFSFSTKAFSGTQLYSVADIPDIDILLITHDHWDHLDYNTVRALQPKVSHVVTGLGTDLHLLKWGYKREQITALDWYETTMHPSGVEITATPSRHFSGRTLKRNQTLWCSFVLSIHGKKIFVGGDSGYGRHFKEIGERLGPFDVSILELGQYHLDWRYIHMLPEEHLKAIDDLGSRLSIPVHNSTFALSTHAWYEPLVRLTKANTEHSNIITPSIGQLVHWDAPSHERNSWWEDYV